MERARSMSSAMPGSWLGSPAITSRRAACRLAARPRRRAGGQALVRADRPSDEEHQLVGQMPSSWRACARARCPRTPRVARMRDVEDLPGGIGTRARRRRGVSPASTWTTSRPLQDRPAGARPPRPRTARRGAGVVDRPDEASAAGAERRRAAPRTPAAPPASSAVSASARTWFGQCRWRTAVDAGRGQRGELVGQALVPRSTGGDAGSDGHGW